MSLNGKSAADWAQDEALNRFKMIDPLLEEGLHSSDRAALKKEISQRYDLSIRTVERYYAAYKEHGFEGLKPRPKGRQDGLSKSERFMDQLTEAKVLLRENPSRPVQMIIDTLVNEGKAENDEISRASLQKYLFKDGYGKRHLRASASSSAASSNVGQRFCKPHRMMLVQTDFKYSITLPLKEGNGKNVTAYLCTQLDDHSRFILDSTWYLHQTGEAVEDSVKRAIMKYGIFDKWYCDNGSSFNSKFINAALPKLGIRKLNAKPYAPKSKGKVEKYHQVVDRFLDEVKLDKRITDIPSLNRWWHIFLNQYYINEPHSGIAEYYKQNRMEYPKEGITPEQEFNRDTRPLKFLDVSLVVETFRHTKDTVVRGGCVQFNAMKYKADAVPNGTPVTIFYEPFGTDTIIIRTKGVPDIISQPITIGEYIDFEAASRTTTLPIFEEQKNPQGISRVLEGMAKRYEAETAQFHGAISFASMDSVNEGGNKNYD